jgi:hypothetical protein
MGINTDRPVPGRDYRKCDSLGVISILQKKPSRRLAGLLEKDRVVAIFRREEGGKTIVQERDVLVLVNFLHRVTRAYNMQASDQGLVLQLNTKALDPRS